MTQKTDTHPPQVELATKDWTLKELTDTERRIEKAFHKQTQFLADKNDRFQTVLSTKYDTIEKTTQDQMTALTNKLDSQTKWMVGLVISMTIAIIVAVLFKG